MKTTNATRPPRRKAVAEVLRLYRSLDRADAALREALDARHRLQLLAQREATADE